MRFPKVGLCEERFCYNPAHAFGFVLQYLANIQPRHRWIPALAVLKKEPVEAKKRYQQNSGCLGENECRRLQPALEAVELPVRKFWGTGVNV